MNQIFKHTSVRTRLLLELPPGWLLQSLARHHLLPNAKVLLPRTSRLYQAVPFEEHSRIHTAINRRTPVLQSLQNTRYHHPHRSPSWTHLRSLSPAKRTRIIARTRSALHRSCTIPVSSTGLASSLRNCFNSVGTSLGCFRRGGNRSSWF